MKLVEANDLYRLHRSRAGTAMALQGLTLDVREGELLAIYGPSGSGKSTLLRILAGLDNPSAGSVRVADHDLRTLRGKGLAHYRARILGYADQHYAQALAPDMPAKELVTARLRMLGASTAVIARTSAMLLERIGLEDRADAFPHELSGGQQQRIAVASALAHRPTLFIADEPSGELDAKNAQQIYQLIRELSHEQRATVVIVSHDPGAAAIADRVIHIRDGRVSAEGDKLVVNHGGWIRLPDTALNGGERLSVDSTGETIILSGHPSPRLTVDAVDPRSTRGNVVAVISAAEKSYRDSAGAKSVLHDFDLSVRAGEFVAVVGRSGSGKSTLLRILAGLEMLDSGEVRIGDVSLVGLTRAERARIRRERVALIAQGADLTPFLTAHEVVEVALAVREIGGDRDALARSALEEVGLGELMDQRVSRLSMGERQRVAVARAVASQPKLILADEPSSRLDETNARELGRLLAKLVRRAAVGVLCATHDPALIEYADRVISLDTEL